MYTIIHHHIISSSVANLTINRIVLASDWLCSDTLLAIWYKAPSSCSCSCSCSSDTSYTKHSAQQQQQLQQDTINVCNGSNNTNITNSGGGGSSKLETQFVFADWKTLKVKKSEPTKEYRNLYLQQLRLVYKVNFQPRL